MADFKKLLIVDDSITILEIVKKFIGNKTYEVITANNGVSGLKMAEMEKPDIVLLDIMLPKMDGYEICRRIRNNSDLAKTKILIFSVKSDKASMDTGYKAGADDYLAKESGLEIIADRVDRLLNPL